MSARRSVPVWQVYPVSVPESIAVGSRLMEVRALDADAGSNAAVRYAVSAESNSAADCCAVDADTGVITLTRPLDRELCLRPVRLYVRACVHSTVNVCLRYSSTCVITRSLSLRIHHAINIH